MLFQNRRWKNFLCLKIDRLRVNVRINQTICLDRYEYLDQKTENEWLSNLTVSQDANEQQWRKDHVDRKEKKIACANEGKEGENHMPEKETGDNNSVTFQTRKHLTMGKARRKRIP